MIVIFILLLLIPNTIFTRSGLDVSGICPHFDCLLKNGYTSAIIEAVKVTGEVNENAKNSIPHAKLAGFLSVDVSLYPCRGRDPSQQVDSLLNDPRNGKLNSNYNMVWVLLDNNPSFGCSWSSYSIISNCEYLKKIVQALEFKGKKVGIYSNKEKWIQIFGNEDFCKDFSNYPLWYSNLNNDPSFSDWNVVRFGGWIRPSIKQYIKGAIVCNCEINLNFF